jgi:hypothetical protein
MRLSSMFFALLLAPLILSAQTSAVFAPPQSSQSCPVRLTAERLSNYGRIEAGSPALSEEQRKQRELTQQLRQLTGQKAVLETELAQQGSAADPAVIKDLRAQIQALNAKLSAKSDEITALTGPVDPKEQLEDAAEPRQGLNLTFAQPLARIVSADITMHFYSTDAHIIPATPPAPHGTPITETFHLTPDSGESLLHSTLWPEHRGIISWVELTRLDYTDGTAWQSSAPRQCSAAPSLYVPVASAH